MDTDQEERKREKRKKLTCPSCQNKLHKNLKGHKEENMLALGIWACHDCGWTWLIQNVKHH